MRKGKQKTVFVDENQMDSSQSDIEPVTGSLKDFNIDYPITDLLRGYTQENECFVCLGCDFSTTDEETAGNHWRQCHHSDLKRRFSQLISMDSVLGFSGLEKACIYRMFWGMSNKEIAEELNIKAVTTVNSIRQRLKALYNKSKLALLLENMMPQFKTYTKKSHQDIGKMMPGLDQPGGNIIGLFTKDQLHNSENPIAHTSVILIVAAKRNNRWLFLVKDKGAMATSFHRIKNPRFTMLDFPGGHVELQDCIDSQDCVRIPEKIPVHYAFRNAGKRELLEEVKGIQGFYPENLIEFCEIKYEGPTFPIGYNVGMSEILIYILPETVNIKEIKVYDEWIDTLGAVVRRAFSVQFKTWTEIDALYDQDHHQSMDGLKRVIEEFRAVPALKNRLYALLNKEIAETPVNPNDPNAQSILSVSYSKVHIEKTDF